MSTYVLISISNCGSTTTQLWNLFGVISKTHNEYLGTFGKYDDAMEVAYSFSIPIVHHYVHTEVVHDALDVLANQKSADINELKGIVSKPDTVVKIEDMKPFGGLYNFDYDPKN